MRFRNEKLIKVLSIHTWSHIWSYTWPLKQTGHEHDIFAQTIIQFGPEQINEPRVFDKAMDIVATRSKQINEMCVSHTFSASEPYIIIYGRV